MDELTTAKLDHTYFLEQVENRTKEIEKISLSEMNGVRLMNRVDVKYVLPVHVLPNLLQVLGKHYKILDIDGERISPYKTCYYDTQDFALYHAHQVGRGSRYKVRTRSYVNSNLTFFEIKHKTNKGNTQKTRILEPNAFGNKLNKAAAELLETTTPLQANQLKKSVLSTYDRITLVSKTAKERLTIDINLAFEKAHETVAYPQVAIAEIKQDKLSGSPAAQILKKWNIRPGSISKYCLGLISTQTKIKHNRFKTKHLHLKKIIAQYDNFARSNSTTRSHSVV